MTEQNNAGSTRRVVMRLALAGAAAVVAAPQAEAQARKLAQRAVQYVAESKRPQKCDTCVHWVAPNACKIVEGEIAAAGWCVSYAPAPKPAG